MLALTTLTADPAAIVPACVFVGDLAFEVLAPGQSESAVPLNTSIWIRVRDQGHEVETVTVRDGVTNLEVPSHVEALHTLVRNTDFNAFRERALRVVLDVDLEPTRSYFIEWSHAGVDGGHTFTTGTARDDTPPDAPHVISTESGGANSGCAATFGLTIAHDGDADLLYEPIVQGQIAGLGRGDPVDLLVGEAALDVVGSLVAVDLAGNRSADGASFAGTTWPAPPLGCSGGLCGDTTRSDGVFSCASTRGGSGAALGVLGVALVVVARRRGRGRAA